MYLLCRKRARIRNSGWFFLYRKVHNRRYVAVFNWRERTKKTYFSEKKKPVNVTATYLEFQSVEKLSVHKIPSVVYRSEAENFRGLLPDVSGRKPCKQTSSSSNANIYWPTVRRNLRKNGQKGNLARAGRERFESQR